MKEPRFQSPYGPLVLVAAAVVTLWSLSSLAWAGDGKEPPPGSSARTDPSFAELALTTLAGDETTREAMANHPALTALIRHQQMAGNPSPDPAQVLDDILAHPGNTQSAARNLAYWSDRTPELWQYATTATTYLPPDTPIEGHLYLIIGYDIGVAAPPDLLLNVAHPTFENDPMELAWYATHEAHHVGFLAHRPLPSLQNLDDPAVLKALIRYCTHMEGMAVHAALATRAANDALGGDEDYTVYTDEAAALHTIARYREVLDLIDDRHPVDGPTLGQVLGAMSSGERLWYRLGALVAHEIEQTSGRDALVATVTDPAAFDLAADLLLER